MAAISNSSGISLQPISHPSEPEYEIESKMIKVGTHTHEPLPQGMRIIFINGILNGLIDPHASAVDISRAIFNKKISVVYNDTLSVAKTVGELAAKIGAKYRKCREELNQIGRTASKVCIVVIGHSHGAAILEHALKDASLSELKKEIRIVTIGGAALIESPPYQSVINLINDLDFVPLVAHKEFNLSLSSDTPWIIRFILEIAVEVKNRFQAEILMIDSPKKVSLGNRIFSQMQSTLETTTEDTSNHVFFRSLGKDIGQFIIGILSSPCETPEGMLGSIVTETTGMVSAYGDYQIEILRTSENYRSVPIKELFRAHVVEAYIPTLSRHLLQYIEEHQTQIL